MPTSTMSGVLIVDGEELQWHIARRGGSSNMYENYRGIAVEVVLEPGRTKPLRLEFPFRTYRWSLPGQRAEFETRLTDLIREGIARGWQPNKRGKPFVLEVEDESAA
jgi:hypothetical protein